MGVILGYIGVMLGLYGDDIGISERKMETTMCILGLYRVKGKEDGSPSLAFGSRHSTAV